MPLRVGKRYRYIIRSLDYIIKLDLNQPYYHQAPIIGQDTPMLGGVYEIYSRRFINLKFEYQLYADNVWWQLSKKNFTPIEKAPSCPYKKGEHVIFSPRCSKSDKRYASSMGVEENGIYTIDKIINDYYIILNICRMPFIWTDFIPIK